MTALLASAEPDKSVCNSETIVVPCADEIWNP